MLIRISFNRQKAAQRAYFKKIIRRDLRIFWEAFGKYGINKIELLREFSEKIYNYNPQRRKVRRFFNKDKNLRLSKEEIIYARCYVCGDSPVIRHHIIQIQHGGVNVRENLIRICRTCHEKIHPWMYERRIEKEGIELNLALDNEFKAVISGNSDK